MIVRCLIVDDNPGFLETAAGLLRREGVSVVGLAATVAEAMARVQKTRPDVVLVDIMLGSESGFDLARRLAEEGDSDERKIILISTYSAEDFADLIAANPAIGFLSKRRLSAEAIERLLAKG